jgi:hypothetical protein
VSGELCLQQEVAGAETKKAGLECCLDGDEGMGGGGRTPPLNLNPQRRRKMRRGK